MTDPDPQELAPSLEDHQRDVARLKHHVAEMTGLATGMVADGVRALLTNDRELSASVISRDAPLDRYDLNVEVEAIRLVAILQPEGPDLRTLEAILKIASCVDRVGRLGYDLALYTVPATDPSDPQIADLLREMDRRARAMVDQAMQAFLANDVARVKGVFAMDDDVDKLCRDVQKRIITLLRKGGAGTDRLAYELLASRHLERVADNAGKIAEKAVYALTGERRSEYFPGLVHPPAEPD